VGLRGWGCVRLSSATLSLVLLGNTANAQVAFCRKDCQQQKGTLGSHKEGESA
jgi:hypothetical protein